MSRATGRQPLKAAWLSVAFIPVGLFVAVLLGESIPGVPGNGWTHDQDLPPGLIAALTAVAVLLVALPSASAVWYAGNAIRVGERRGIAPLVIGLVALVFLAVTTISGITSVT